jgi:hypothetical protein
MRPLVCYADYSREDVHDIFAPATPFTPQRGTWGLHGIVPIPDRPGDFVFFVTYGQRQGEHEFDEDITENGVLSWQSQPSQTLDDAQIHQFIAHDNLRNSIYLFLRTARTKPYTYLGRLGYLTHDVERTMPVYFQWQILDWDPPPEILERMGLALRPPADGRTNRQPSLARNGLERTAPPRLRPPLGITTPGFRSRKSPDYAARDAANRQLGRAGEILVVEHECRWLAENNRDDLAAMVRHVAALEGDGAGYDVASFALDGAPRYIEVKTTRGPAGTAFYMTAHELEYARNHAGRYSLYRLYEYDSQTGYAKFYVLDDKIEDGLIATPVQYRMSIRPADAE